jgi:N-methylhydantoinase A
MNHNHESSATRRYWLAFDVGGTFVDVLSFDLQTGRIGTTKYRSSRQAAADSVRAGLTDHLTSMRAQARQSARLVHGTTLVTNLLVERAGARVGVITTRGFRDVLEIGRMRRPSLYDLNADKPAVLAERPCRLEVTERIDGRGNVITALKEDEVMAAIEILRARGVEAVAVCFLHSYANPVHEQRAAKMLEDAGFPVSLSSEVSAEFGEFERFSTAVINVLTVPAVRNYLDKLRGSLQRLDIDVPLQIMQSNGGVISGDVAARFPVRLASSGPAAGVTGAAVLAARAGCAKLITFDMGGTSTDVGLVAGGEVAYASEHEVSGYPVRTVGIDIRSIGAGGGSLAVLDRTGSLRVGPASAGAEPGPACYGWGGSRPTVADADLVLGYLNEQRFCGGRMTLRRDLAAQAIETHISGPRGVSVDDAAIGILRVCVTNMVGAVRNITMQQGHDPRDFVLVAYGGAGPVHATFVASELQIPQVLVLRDSGLLSAKGLLLTNYRVDVYRTYVKTIDEVDCAALNALFIELEGRAVAELSASVVGRTNIRVRRILELCYEGQQSAVPVDVDALPVRHADLSTLRERLDTRFRELFGFVPVGRRPQIMHVRVFAEHDLDVQRMLEAKGLDTPRPGREREPKPAGLRKVLYPGTAGRIQVPVYEHDELIVGDGIQGPAIVEEDYTNTVIGPGQRCRVDDHGNLHIDVHAGESVGGER